MRWRERLRLWTSPRALLRRLLALDDTPHAIALGTAVGIFVAMTPTVGIQMILVLVVALLTRPLFYFNRMAGLVAVYVSNPLTTVPIYWFDYQVGTLFFEGTVSHEQFAALLRYRGLAEWWQTLVELFVVIGAPLIVGSLVVATVFGGLTYPVMLWLLRLFRRGRADRSVEAAREASASPRPETVRRETASAAE